MTIRRGDVFRHELPGGGGWGDPLERDPAAVLSDVRNEYVSQTRAEAEYGVVVDTRAWRIDAVATDAARRRLRAARGDVPLPAVQRGDTERVS